MTKRSFFINLILIAGSSATAVANVSISYGSIITQPDPIFFTDEVGSLYSNDNTGVMVLGLFSGGDSFITQNSNNLGTLLAGFQSIDSTSVFSSPGLFEGSISDVDTTALGFDTQSPYLVTLSGISEYTSGVTEISGVTGFSVVQAEWGAISSTTADPIGPSDNFFANGITDATGEVLVGRFVTDEFGFNYIQAVPEPSFYAALFGVLSIFFVLHRKRRN